MRSPAKPYQSVIASAVQAMADGKNSLGLGKNETNMVGVFQAQVRGFADFITRYRACGEGRKRHIGGGPADPTLVARTEVVRPRTLKSQYKIKAMASPAFERFRFSFFEDPDSPRQGLDMSPLPALEGR